MNQISRQIINWYKANARDLPWRKTSNPYFIWLSEVILQQTRVAQGLAYYQRFIEKFPTVQDLADAEEDQVLEIWQGLGYYSRARNLHKTARQLVKDFQGKFPEKYLDLLRLKGIGPYTAAAISSFAFHENEAVVDGNVIRVLARLFLIEDEISQPKVQKQFREIAYDLLPIGHSYEFNQGIMELGAMVCTPQNPDCTHCPVFEFCQARKVGAMETLPNKKRPKEKRKRFLNYLLLESEGEILLTKRGPKDIWEGLYEPILSEGDRSFSSLNEFKDRFAQIPVNWLESQIFPPLRHILTHQELWVVVCKAKLSKKAEIQGFIWVKKENLDSVPKPVIISKILQSDQNGQLTLGF